MIKLSAHWRKWLVFKGPGLDAWRQSRVPSAPHPTAAHHTRYALTSGVPSPSQGRAQHHQYHCQKYCPGASRGPMMQEKSRGQGAGKQKISLREDKGPPPCTSQILPTKELIISWFLDWVLLVLENQSVSYMNNIIGCWSEIRCEVPLSKLSFPSLGGFFWCSA